MAKKSSDGEQLLSHLFTGFMGAAFASPSPADKENLRLLKQYEKDFSAFIVLKERFAEYRREESIKVTRTRRLRDLRIDKRILQYPETVELYKEACEMYRHGLYRGASFFAVSAMEVLLSKLYPNDNKLVAMIDNARSAGLIEESDKHFLHALRLERNDVHKVKLAITEHDATTVFQITSRIMKTIFDKQLSLPNAG